MEKQNNNSNDSNNLKVYNNRFTVSTYKLHYFTFAIWGIHWNWTRNTLWSYEFSHIFTLRFFYFHIQMIYSPPISNIKNYFHCFVSKTVLFSIQNKINERYFSEWKQQKKNNRGTVKISAKYWQSVNQLIWEFRWINKNVNKLYYPSIWWIYRLVQCEKFRTVLVSAKHTIRWSLNPDGILPFTSIDFATL